MLYRSTDTEETVIISFSSDCEQYTYNINTKFKYPPILAFSLVRFVG